MHTYADVLEKQNRIQKYKKLTGKKLLRVVNPVKVKVRDIDIHSLLLQCGYNKTHNGYVRKIDNIYRYHAFIVDGNIEIHTDKTKTKNGKKYHIASTYLGGEERKRINSFIPYKNTIPKKVKYKEETLSLDEQKKAVRKVKLENDMRRIINKIKNICKIKSV